MNGRTAHTNIARQVATYVHTHPVATRADIAEALGVSVDEVSAAWDTAVHLVNGYTLPAERTTNAATPAAQCIQDLHTVAAALASTRVSRPQYDAYRAHHRGAGLLNSETIRRRFGTWNNALAAAGLIGTYTSRDYNGIDANDAAIWLAHYLRELVNAQRGLLPASEDNYHAWTRTRPHAPSTAVVKNLFHGSFGAALRRASLLEKNMTTLPAAKPISNNGRRKDSA